MEILRKKFDDEQKQFLNFLKGRYNLFHMSNVFFRDIHYGVMAYLEMNNLGTSYASAETLTRSVVDGLAKKGILLQIDPQTFVLTYPEFKKPAVVKPAPAKPAAPASAIPAASAKPAQPLQPKTEPITEAQKG